MGKKERIKTSCVFLMIAGLMLQPFAALAQEFTNNQPFDQWNRGEIGPYLSLAQKIELLRKKVKYVFVIFHENESFDHYFGTFPGANGLFSAPRGATPANETPSFEQKYLDTSLNTVTISPFLMPQAVQTSGGQIVPIYPADEISVDHSHQGMANGLDVNPATRVAANDRYAMDQEGLTTDVPATS